MLYPHTKLKVSGQTLFELSHVKENLCSSVTSLKSECQIITRGCQYNCYVLQDGYCIAHCKKMLTRSLFIVSTGCLQ